MTVFQKWIVAASLGLALLLLAPFGFYLWLDTSSGHAFIARQIAAYELENGLNFRLRRIEGSIYGKATLVDLRIQDDKGTFARIPKARLDWHPRNWLYGIVSIRAIEAKDVQIQRLPELRLMPDRGQPFFPDLDIRIDRLHIERILFDKAITGRQHEFSLDGKARIVEARALVEASGTSAKGDRLLLKLDAIPDANRLDMALRLDGPANGLAAGLTGFDSAVSLTLVGKGSWRKWDGRLMAAAGPQRWAGIAIAARNGSFAASGRIVTGLDTAPQAANGWLGRELNLDIAARLKGENATLKGRLESDRMRIMAAGAIDLQRSRFENLVINMEMPQPTHLIAGVSSRALKGRFLIEGAAAEPRIDYALTSDEIRLNDVTLQGVTAKGVANILDDHALIPLKASSRRMAGVDIPDKRMLENVRLDGNLAWSNGRLLAERLSLRSNRANAIVKGAADFGKGSLAASIKGNIDGFSIESVGLFDIDADLGLKSRLRSDYMLSGMIRARSTQLVSKGVRDFLGGQMLVRAGIALSENKIVRIVSAQLISPQVRLDRGSGTYALGSGNIAFSGSGHSVKYGPVALELEGTLETPVARVRAQRPGMGIGLANVSALVKRTATGFAAQFDAMTDYGPLDGDVEILSGASGVTLDVRRADFSGIRFAGRLRQMPAGPFAGQLMGSGAGFDGTALLSAEGRYQRIAVSAFAANAALHGRKNLSIGRGSIDADIVLFDQPQVRADVQLGDTRIDALYIAAARAKIDYRGGKGNARFLAEGRTSFPFRVAANVGLSENLWEAALKGRANGVSFASAKPIRIIPEIKGYRLLPSTLNVGNGMLRLEGRYADGLQARARIDDVNLAFLNPILPGFEIRGRASGLVDWQQESFDAVPRAQLHLEIERFTRSSIGTPAQPVSISLKGRLDASGGGLSALIERSGTKIGRLQLRLGALPGNAGGWAERLLAAPLSGGIRYNGPADLLFSLAALPDQSLVGPVAVAADFSGQLNSPNLTGTVRSDNLVYENETYGTRLTQMRLRGVFDRDMLRITEIAAVAGNGAVTGQGFINLSAERGFPAQIDLNLDRARLARSELISTSATGKVEVTHSADGGALVSGTLAMPQTRFRIVRQGAARVTTLSGVRRKSANGPIRISGDADPVRSLPSDWKLDLKLVAADELFITGMGLESEWQADLHVTGRTDAPTISGEMQLVRGTLDFAGRSFGIETGRLSFNGGAYSNPALRVVAASEVDGTTVRVEVRGTGNRPEITFSSTPALPQDEIMARILFGNSVAELSAVQAVQLAASLNSLRAAPGGLNPLGVLQSATGIDRLRILNPDEASGRGAAIALGQYITNDVYVEIVTDARGYTASQIEISLTPALSVLSQLSSFGTSNVSVRYRKDY